MNSESASAVPSGHHDDSEWSRWHWQVLTLRPPPRRVDFLRLVPAWWPTRTRI
jgi:hypothetical protein